MAQDVGRYLFLEQGRARLRGGRGVLGDPSFQGVAAERGAAAGDEQRAGWQPAAFGEPAAQDGDGGGGERGDALLAALALGDDVRARACCGCQGD